MTPCSFEEFYCVVEDFCVPLEYLCDGIPDCFVAEAAGSDESDCPPRKYTLVYFICTIILYITPTVKLVSKE